MKRILCALLLMVTGLNALGAGFAVRGKVTDAAGAPIPGAVLRLDENYLWAVTDADGRFVFESVEPGSYRMETGSLGYAPDIRTLRVTAPVSDASFGRASSISRACGHAARTASAVSSSCPVERA